MAHSHTQQSEPWTSNPGQLGDNSFPEDTDLQLVSIFGIKVLEKTTQNLKQNGKLSDDDLMSLHWTFGPLVMSAFEIIDNSGVHVFESETDRYIIRVSGSKGGQYWIPLGSNHCQCVAYQWKKDFCKHILAAHFYLAIMGEDDDYYAITDAELNDLYTNILSKDW